jgi:hypothetical protein
MLTPSRLSDLVVLELTQPRGKAFQKAKQKAVIVDLRGAIQLVNCEGQHVAAEFMGLYYSQKDLGCTQVTIPQLS